MLDQLIKVRHPNTGLVTTAVVRRKWKDRLAGSKAVFLVDCTGDAYCRRVHLVSESNTRNVFDMWEGDTK